MKFADEPTLYYNLAKRQRNILEGMDKFDIMERFAREETKEFLKKEAGKLYEAQVKRLARERHKKEVTAMRKRLVSRYLIQAEKTLMKYGI